MNSQGGWVLEVDIRKFFDNLDHGHLRKFLQLRVRDGVLLRLIGKWLNAGVSEDGSISYPDSGSPQGGVGFTFTFEHLPAPRAGPVVRARGKTSSKTPCLSSFAYADDFVIGFRDYSDAQRVMEVVSKRFGKYGLTVPSNQDETGSLPSAASDGRVIGTNQTIVLGRLTCWDLPTYWGRSRRGHWIVKQKTASDRFGRAVQSIDSWCRGSPALATPAMQ